MVNFQKLESSVASLEKQLQEVKEQIAEIRNAYQEECHPGKTDIRQYILEKATERFGENYMKPEEDRGFFDDFYDAVKRKVKKDSMIMGYSENDVDYGSSGDKDFIEITVSQTAAGNNSSSILSVSAPRIYYVTKVFVPEMQYAVLLKRMYKLLLDILEYVNA